MSYKRITIEFENGRTHVIDNPIAYKVWQWDDVKSLLEDYAFDDETEGLTIEEIMSIVKENMDVSLVRNYLEMCTDDEWDTLEDYAYRAFEENT